MQIMQLLLLLLFFFHSGSVSGWDCAISYVQTIIFFREAGPTNWLFLGNL